MEKMKILQNHMVLTQYFLHTIRLESSCEPERREAMSAKSIWDGIPELPDSLDGELAALDFQVLMLSEENIEVGAQAKLKAMAESDVRLSGNTLSVRGVTKSHGKCAHLFFRLLMNGNNPCAN